MKRDAEFFDESEVTLVYIAKRLKDALRLESVLTGAGVDYHVETDRYRGGFLFPSERIGAFFYVASNVKDSVRQLMRESGYKPHESGDLQVAS